MVAYLHWRQGNICLLCMMHILWETLCSCVLVHWWTIYPVPLTNCLCRWSTLSESPRFTSCLNRKMLLKTRPWRMLSCLGLQNKRWRIKKISSVLTLCEHAGNNTMKFYAHSPLLRPFKFIGNGLKKCATALLCMTLLWNSSRPMGFKSWLGFALMVQVWWWEKGMAGCKAEARLYTYDKHTLLLSYTDIGLQGCQPGFEVCWPCGNHFSTAVAKHGKLLQTHQGLHDNPHAGS